MRLVDKFLYNEEQRSNKGGKREKKEQKPGLPPKKIKKHPRKKVSLEEIEKTR